MTLLNSRMMIAVVFLAVAGVGCKGDPTADLRGGPAILSLTPQLMFIGEGTSRGFEVVVRDEQLNPVPANVTVTSTNTGVFTVEPDPTVPTADNTRHTFIIDAVATGQARLAVSAGGVADTATITVLPTAFPSPIPGPVVIGDTLLLVMTNPLFSFDLTEANVDFGDDIVGDVLLVTPETLMVRVPQPEASQPSILNITGVAVEYVPGLVVTLPSAAPINVVPVGDRETPGEVVITVPADGGPDLVFWDGFKAGANGVDTFIDYWYEFTLAATDTLTFTLDWEGAADLDMINFRTDFSIIGGFGAATGSNPETYTVIFPAGTYYLLVESFDDHDEPAHLFRVTIRNP